MSFFKFEVHAVGTVTPSDNEVNEEEVPELSPLDEQTNTTPNNPEE